jgi:hypothetical protein
MRSSPDSGGPVIPRSSALKCAWTARLRGTIAWSREIRWAASAATLVIGRNVSEEPGCAGAFTGQVHSTQRATDGRDPLLGSDGDGLRMRLVFPSGRQGAREPLVVTGRTGAGDILMVEYVGERTIRFAVDHWGGPLLASEPIVVDFSVPHEVIVATTAWRGPTESIPLRMVRKGAIRVQLDGNAVWQQPVPTFASRPDEIAVGANPIGGTSAAPRFTGDILTAERTSR